MYGMNKDARVLYTPFDLAGPVEQSFINDVSGEQVLFGLVLTV